MPRVFFPSSDPAASSREMMPDLRRHLPLRLLLLGLALAAGLAVNFASHPVFYARALVRLGAPGTLDRARAVAKELTQASLLERTAGRLGVKLAESELRRTHLFGIVAEPVSAQEIEVEVWTHSPDWARRWTEALVAECLDFRRVRRRKERTDFIRALNRELAEIAEKLGQADTIKAVATDRAGLTGKLAELKELRNPAREIEALTKRLEELGRLHADLRKTDIPIVEKLPLLSAVEQASGTDEANTGSAWEAIEEKRRPLIEELARIEFASHAPDFSALALHPAIAEIDRKLQVEFDTNFHRFDVDYRNLLDRKAALEEKAARPHGPAEMEMDLRIRHLAQRIDALGESSAGEGGDPVYAGLREMPGSPVSPNFWKIALLSLLSGGILAVAVPPIAERFGPGRTAVHQIEAQLGAPALGSLATIRNLPRRTPLLADAEDPHLGLFGETFRKIRDGLLSGTGLPRVLLVTSAMPGEGKTTVAANLGIAFAETGVRTLVVDTDLRRGRLHRLFGYRIAPGLGNVIAGNIPAQQAIRSTPHENLYVMNAGAAPGSEANPLDSAGFKSTIAQLRDALDLLIFDAPPVLGLPAAALLAPHADAAILVVTPGQMEAARAALGMLEQKGLKVSGFVLNQRPA